MDSKDRSIATQVAFKAAIDAERDIDLTDPAGQARFHEVFEYLQTELVTAIVMLSDESEQVAQIIQGEFPGSQIVSGPTAGAPYQQYEQPQYTTAQPAAGVRGLRERHPVRPVAGLVVRAGRPEGCHRGVGQPSAGARQQAPVVPFHHRWG